MPITEDIMDHDLFGPMIRKARAEGHQKQACTMLRRMIEKRFGPLDSAFEDSLSNLPLKKLETLSLRILDARSVEELFRPKGL